MSDSRTRARIRRCIDRRMRRGDDSGIAMISVMGFGLILLIVAGVVLDYGVNSLRQAGRDQGFQGAIAAAEAGIDDYLYRVNSDSNYVNYTSVAKTCSGGTGTVNKDSANPAMSGYTPVPGGASGSLFKYDVDTSSFCTNGMIKVKSTGKVGGVTRTEQALIKKRGFLDYLYYTDMETTDPDAYATNIFAGQNGYSAPNNTVAVVCGRHYYDPTSVSPSKPAPRPDDIDGANPGCDNINFGGGDVLDGPVHTNDAMLVCGTVTFKGKTTTSWKGSAPAALSTNLHYRKNSSCGTTNATFSGNSTCVPSGGVKNDACYASALNLPPSNSNLKAETDPSLSNPAGCLFTGPTKIALTSDGKMSVTSPDTPRTGYNTGCGPLSVDKYASTPLPIPANGVVYVQSVPAGATSVPCTKPTTSWVSAPNPVGYPAYAGDVTKYGCTDGDVFVSGTLAGGLTIGSDHNVVITDDVKYKDGTTGSDILGLIAQNYVEVYHPVNSSGTNLSTAISNLTIQAAMLSMTHSFRVQNYNKGATLGTLAVKGVIAQKFRGAVGTVGSTGYTKSYSYDTRLRYLSPPHFIDPVQSSYQVSFYAEQ